MPQTRSIDELRAQVSQMLDRLDPDTPIGSTVVFKVRRQQEGAFERMAAALTDATCPLRGCRIFGFHRHQSVHSDREPDSAQYLIYEEWDSARAFREQWNSEHLRHFQHSVMDLVTAPPDLDFYTGQAVSGTMLRVLKSGQTQCFDTKGDPIDCKGTGQDGEYQEGLAASGARFQDNHDGTVTDSVTGLIWLKDADTFGEVGWQQALQNARNLASGSHGLSDRSAKGAWRLANIREMLSLIDYGMADPIIPAGHPFINVKTAIYWTSTTLAPAPIIAWMMTLGIGPTVFDVKHSPASRMWPVRGQGRVPTTGQKQCWDVDGNPVPAAGTGQDGELQAGAAFTAQRFTDNNNGTVTDNMTGVWLKDANPFGFRTWEEALTLCNNLESGNFGLSDSSEPGLWRLPNIREAESLVDYNNAGPCLPAGHPFVNLRPSSYWTSTSVNSAPSEAMFLIYAVGPSIFESKEHPFFVWPVRNKRQAE